jgi:hypothetical protein
MLSVLASQLLQTNKRRVDEDDLFTGLENMYEASKEEPIFSRLSLIFTFLEKG